MSRPVRWCSRLVPLLILVTSCGEGSTAPETGEPTRVSLTPPAAALSWIGDSRQLVAEVLGKGGEILPGQAVSWSSSDVSVATVTPSGVVEAVGVGQTSINAASGAVSHSAAIIVAQAPESVVKISGDSQESGAQTALPDDLIVQVRDRGGSVIAGASVRWVVSLGGGALSSAHTQTDEMGQTSVRWTLGGLIGIQSVTASAGAASVQFSAEATVPADPDLTVTSVSPSPLQEGVEAVVSGAGLNGAVVEVGGLPAEITASSYAQLTFVVPISDCLPARDATVRVQRLEQSVTVTTTVVPQLVLAPLQLGGGWIDRGTDAEGHCLHFPSTDEDVTYLIGVQSLSEDVELLTPVGFKMGTGVAVPVPPRPSRMAEAELGEHLSGVEAWTSPRDQPSRPATSAVAAGLSQVPRQDPVRARHSTAHLEQRARDEREVRRLLSTPRSRIVQGQRPLTQAPPDLGDELVVRVPENCTQFTTITATVRAVGSRAVWLEDTNNPEGGFTPQDFQSLSSQYDGLIGARLDQYAGSPTDLDDNGRIVVVVTREVNETGNLLGFVSSADLFSTESCPASNEGEYFYGIAPDPSGLTANQTTHDEALALYPSLVAHEVSHIIHLSRQIYIVQGSDFPRTWEFEGFATLMQELVGHGASGLGSGQNLDFADWFANLDWYGDFVADVVSYFGFDYVSGKVAGAPQECSWLERPPNGPCVNDERLVYGVPASLFRWIADRYFTPATESQMTRAIADTPVHGFELLSLLAGDDLDIVMAGWAGALIADDTYLTTGPLSFGSWDLGSIYGGLVPPARPQPQNRGHSFAESLGVRAGSAAYFFVTGSHGQISFGAPGLSTDLRLWAIRIE